MFIRCWGSRGSTPVSGKDYLEFGGDTTCFEISADSGEIIIIDAGTGIRGLGKSLTTRKEFKFYLLLTHFHWDHIIGLPFFAPLLDAKNQLIIQDRIFEGLSTKQVLSRIMSPPLFPVNLSDYQAGIVFDSSLNGQFSIGSIDIETIPASHSEGSMGYKFKENGKAFVLLTDNELGHDHPQGGGFDDYVGFCQGADILFHDAEYTAGEYKNKIGWGHSMVPDVVNLAAAAGVKRLGMVHINQDRTDKDMKQMVKDAQAMLKDRLARDGKPPVPCFGVPSGFEIFL